MAEKPDHLVAAERLVGKLPKAVREGATAEKGKGKYSLVKFGNRTVASVRAANVRITVGHDGSAGQLADLAPLVAQAAQSRPPLKSPEERKAERELRKKEREEERARKKKEKEEEKARKRQEAKEAKEAEAEAAAAEGEE